MSRAPQRSAELVWDLQAELAEGPVWHAKTGCLWFVDIKGRQLHRYAPAGGEKRSWNAPDAIGFALPTVAGDLVCGLPDGLHRFDPASGRFQRLLEVEADRPTNRLNDGCVAPDGSIWFGTMDDREASSSGALYRWDGRELVRHDDGYGVTNGPALSPCGRVLYHNDTRAKRIYAFDHHHGQLSNRRVFAKLQEAYPDGVAVDRLGILHVALFQGWGVARFAPSGERLSDLKLPVQTVTKIAFGGASLQDLYCTTAWLGSPDQREVQPGLGGLFRLRVETPGLPSTPARL